MLFLLVDELISALVDEMISALVYENCCKKSEEFIGTGKCKGYKAFSKEDDKE